jgi:hypothetical protein
MGKNICWRDISLYEVGKCLLYEPTVSSSVMLGTIISHIVGW